MLRLKTPRPSAGRKAAAARTATTVWRSAVALAAACAFSAPALAQDAAAAPTAPTAPATASASSTAPTTESLQSLLTRVLPNDPGVRSAAALVEVSRERVRQVRSRFGPNVGVTLTRGDSADIELNRDVDRRTSRDEATLRWNLYNQGNDRAEWNAQQREFDAARADLRRTREETAERIANAYSDLLRWQNLLPVSESRLTDARALVKQLGQQNAAGKTSDADLQQAQAMQIDAEISHEQLLSDLVSARATLKRLTASAADTVPAAFVPVTVVLPPPAGDARTPNSGQIEAARQRAEAARERVQPEYSPYLPRVDAEFRQRLSDRTTPASTTETRHAWTVVARWEMPVLGEAQSRQVETVRRAEAAVAEAERVETQAGAELASLPTRIAQAERAMRQLERQIDTYESLMRAADVQFEAGRRTLTQLLQLRDSHYAAQQRLNEQSSRLLIARLRQLSLEGNLLPALGLALD